MLSEKEPTKEQLFEHDGYRLVLVMNRYWNDTASVDLWTYGYEYNEPYIEVTVNTPDTIKEQEFIDPHFFKSIKDSYPVAFIDINNGPWLPKFLEDNGIAYPVFNGKEFVTYESGHVVDYPLYAFRLDKFYVIDDYKEDLDDEEDN